LIFAAPKDIIPRMQEKDLLLLKTVFKRSTDLIIKRLREAQKSI